MKIINMGGRRAGKTSECEKACDYWFRFKKQDGSWSQWYKTTLTEWAPLYKNPGDDIQTAVTKKGESP